MSRLLASWVPIAERGRLGSLVFAGKCATTSASHTAIKIARTCAAAETYSFFRCSSGQRSFHAVRWLSHAVHRHVDQRVLHVRDIRFIVALVLVRIDL